MYIEKLSEVDLSNKTISLSIMMKVAIFLTILALIPLSYAAGTEQESKGSDKFEKTAYLLVFSDYLEGPVEVWLKSKGFKPEQDANNRIKLDLDVTDDSLSLEAKKPVQAFLINEAVNVKEFSKIRIEWGILKYPKGASYAKNVNNEALMLYIFFGVDKVSSGSYLIPNSPYFIALFLCQDEEINHPYKGRYFHKSGRFICLGKPSLNETVVTEFDLVHAFKTYFGKHEVPGISGISLAVDTTKSGNQGKSSAFLKKIEFLK